MTTIDTTNMVNCVSINMSYDKNNVAKLVEPEIDMIDLCGEMIIPQLGLNRIPIVIIIYILQTRLTYQTTQTTIH